MTTLDEVERTQRRCFLCRRLTTLTTPPTRAPYEPGEATTCEPSVVYGLGVNRRPCGACSAHTSPISPCFHHIVKLAAHAYRVQFWLQLADAGSLCNPRGPDTLLLSSGIAPDPSART